MQLLADRLVEFKVVQRISDETVRKELKKAARALTEKTLVHPYSRDGVCLARGRCVGRVRQNQRLEAPSDLL
jgi:hypothetical protein